jgi:hypothetical protein
VHESLFRLLFAGQPSAARLTAAEPTPGSEPSRLRMGRWPCRQVCLPLVLLALVVTLLPAAGRARRTASSASVKEQITSLYREHNPTKLDALPALFSKYAGNEQELLDAVKEKYSIGGVEFSMPQRDQPEQQETFDVAGRIRVIDGLLSEEHQRILTGAWRHAPYTWGEQDTAGSAPAGTVLELDVDGEGIGPAAVRAVTSSLGPLGELGLSVTGGPGVWVPPEQLNTWVPWRAYVNLFRRGDHPMRHKDNIGFPSVTLLVFPDSEYDSVQCGGELMFFESSSGDAAKAVTPVGGRAAAFDGNVYHSARPPLPGCAQPRLSLAVKFGDPRHAKQQRELAQQNNDEL